MDERCVMVGIWERVWFEVIFSEVRTSAEAWAVASPDWTPDGNSGVSGDVGSGW